MRCVAANGLVELLAQLEPRVAVTGVELVREDAGLQRGGEPVSLARDRVCRLRIGQMRAQRNQERPLPVLRESTTPRERCLTASS